jgi:hypothetical protein
MNAQSNINIRRNTSWLAGALIAGTAVALSAAAAVAAPPTVPQLVPSAEVQGVMGYIRAHQNALVYQSVPSAADQGVFGYIAAHQAAPMLGTADAATQGILSYLRAHGAAVP